MKKIIIALFLMSLFNQNICFANVNLKLEEYFENEIQRYNQSIQQAEVNSGVGFQGGNENEMWFLNRFRLYFRASMGFDAEGLAQLLVQPEFEALFLRYPAPGWANYRPR